MDQVDTYLMTGISSSAPHYTIGTKPLEILSTGPLSYLIYLIDLSRTIFTFCANTKKAYSVSTPYGRLKTE